MTRCLSKYGMLLLCAVLFIVSCSVAQPHIVVRGDSILDFHTMFAGEVRSQRVTIVNTGSSNLIIEHVNAPCHCSTTQLQSKIIPPHDSTFLTLTFDSRNYSGEVQKYVNVVSNDLPRRNSFVRFQVNVVQVMEAKPAFLYFGTVSVGQKGMRSLVLKNLGKVPLKIRSVETGDDSIVTVALSKKKIAPGDSITLTA